VWPREGIPSHTPARNGPAVKFSELSRLATANSCLLGNTHCDGNTAQDHEMVETSPILDLPRLGDSLVQSRGPAWAI
jgi:hypothetical protein